MKIVLICWVFRLIGPGAKCLWWWVQRRSFKEIPYEKCRGYPGHMFNAMHELATQLGMTLHPSDPGYFDIYSTVTVTGEYKGFHVIFERQAALYTFHTRVAFDPGLPIKFSLTREGLVARLSRLVGLPDVEIGDEVFDAAFKISTEETEKLKLLLTPEVKDALLALHKNGGGPQITNHFVDVQRTFVIGELWNGDQVRLDLEPCIAAASALREAAKRLG